MALLTRNIARSCAKPVAGRTPCVALRPRSLVMVRAEPDLSGLAKQAISMGVDALKNVDKDQLKAVATGAVEQAKAAAGITAATVKEGVDTIMAVWSKFDNDGDGKLTISEAVNLLNSPEVSAVVTKTTGMEHTIRTEDEIKKWFERADFDHSGTLSKREFAVLYVGLLCHKAKSSAGGVASALCAVLDSDGDGKIGTTELKRLLSASGLSVLANVAKLVPDGKEVDYRSLLSKIA